MLRGADKCRCRLLWLAGALALALSAKADDDGTWIRGIYTGRSPRAIALPAPIAWRNANRFIATEARDCVVVGTGESMEPLYPAGTLLVLRAVSYDELQPGQTAVYRNRSQQLVAHVLIARTHDGWRIAGLNNSTHDLEPVSADNLIGVVVAAYRPLPESVDNRIASR